MKLKILRKSALLFIVTWGMSVSSHAGVIALSGVGDFSGSETLLDFAGLSYGALGGSYGGVTFTSGGVAATIGGDSFDGDAKSVGSTPIGNPYYSPLILDFSSDINRVGFYARSNGSDGLLLTASLMMGSTVVGLVDYADPGSSAWAFYGIESDIAFDRLVIDPDNNSNGYVRIDALRFEASVPEPMPLMLLGTGIMVLGLRRRMLAKAA